MELLDTSYYELFTRGSVISIILGFVFWLYRKTPSLKVNKRNETGKIILTMRNNKDCDVKISHIRLVRKSLIKEDIYNENTLSGLIQKNDGFFYTSQNDDLGIEMKKNSSSKEIVISYIDIHSLYDDFLPYNYSLKYQMQYLNNIVRMPKCHIAIYLDSGKTIYVDIPKDYYRCYKEYIKFRFEHDFEIYCGRSLTSIHFKNQEQKLLYQKNLLDRYSINIRTFHCLVNR